MSEFSQQSPDFMAFMYRMWRELQRPDGQQSTEHQPPPQHPPPQDPQRPQPLHGPQQSRPQGPPHQAPPRPPPHPQLQPHAPQPRPSPYRQSGSKLRTPSGVVSRQLLEEMKAQLDYLVNEIAETKRTVSEDLEKMRCTLDRFDEWGRTLLGALANAAKRGTVPSYSQPPTGSSTQPSSSAQRPTFDQPLPQPPNPYQGPVARQPPNPYAQELSAPQPPNVAPPSGSYAPPPTEHTDYPQVDYPQGDFEYGDALSFENVLDLDPGRM